MNHIRYWTWILLSFLLLFQESYFILDHYIKWNLWERNFRTWNNMHHIELEWLTWLLASWHNLNPAHALNFINNLAEVCPVNSRHWTFDINFQTLELSFLLIFFHDFLFLVCTHSWRFRLSLKSFSQREVIVNNHILLFLFFIVDLEKKHLTFKLRVWMGN